MLRPHRAADGAVVRIRLIGGRISAAALTAVGAAAQRYGDGTVAVTSRGNLQLRGLAVDEHGDADPGLVAAIAAAGLLPSPSHERIRNVVVSPLTGIAGGLADLRPLAADLDEMVCGTPELSRLSGRFLFGLDDGRGDLSDQTVDLGVTALDRTTGRLRIGAWWGPRLALADAAAALTELALHFLDLSGNAWRMADLENGGRELLPPGRSSEPVVAQDLPRPVGLVDRDDGAQAAVAAVPLGRLDPSQLTTVVDVAEAGPAPARTPDAAHLVVTTDRSIVIPRVRPDAVQRLSTAGLIVDPSDARRAVSACTGAPGCAHAEGPTGTVARTTALQETRASGLPVHVVACERRCGAPARAHLELLVTRAGLRRYPQPTGARTR